MSNPHSNNMMTPDRARLLACPVARINGDGKDPKCRGDGCILWRWEEIFAGHPDWTKAIKLIVAETGEKAPFKDASRKVADDPLAYDIAPEQGWCGLGGR